MSSRGLAEEQRLVRSRADSEDSRLGFGSINAMAYTEDRLNAQEPAITAEAASRPTAAAEQLDAGDRGELLDHTQSNLLEQFHEDAVKQAGCGLAQARVTLACGLCVCGATLELAAIPFIMPSAEVELCILPHEKSWLLLISVVGGALGMMWGGAMGGRLGRRRAMLSCLAVNAVFAAIAAFMPTYGTFMMARFCSALGSGGGAVCACVYCAELAPRAHVRRALAVLLAAHAAGVLIAPTLARAVLPLNGASTLIENKEHFSAWHRYLLLCTLPILASLISLIWTPESPRYLLDVGREVDACVVYQKMHSNNQLRVCGKKADNSAYTLCELALPDKGRRTLRTEELIFKSFYELGTSAYRSMTLSLCGTLVLSMAVLFYLSCYVPSYVLKIENEQYEASKTLIQNTTIQNQTYNSTIENVQYNNVTFVNVIFKDMLMSRVVFKNCTFLNVTLANITPHSTRYMGAVFVNSTLLDAGLEYGRELDPWCTIHNSLVRGVRDGCARPPAQPQPLHAALTEHSAAGGATLVAAVLAASVPHYARTTLILCVCGVLLSPLIALCESEISLYAVEAVYRALLMLVFFEVCARTIVVYPASLRCTGLGVFLCAMYCCAALVAASGASLPPAALCAALCAGAAALQLIK